MDVSFAQLFPDLFSAATTHKQCLANIYDDIESVAGTRRNQMLEFLGRKHRASRTTWTIPLRLVGDEMSNGECSYFTSVGFQYPAGLMATRALDGFGNKR